MRCEHRYYYEDRFSSTITTWKIPGLQKYQTLCTICSLHGPITYDWTESIVAFWNNERKIMSTEDYKRGVEDVLNLLDDLAPNISQSAVRKKLLTKKVTKWTGVILSNYNQKPTMLDIYDSEDDIKHYYTISPALCPPIKLELELPL